MFDLIDFKDCEILYCENSEMQKEDLLQLKCANGRLIDVGWYGSESKYCIYVIENCDWENPCYKICGQPKLSSIEYHLQNVINFETAVFDAPVQEMLNHITSIIDNWRSFNSTFNDVVLVLEQLRNMGLSQNEVSNYIHIYAIKYIDLDEEKWDIACDILDRITGFCSPDLHIWRCIK